jgi:hypothetical protein
MARLDSLPPRAPAFSLLLRRLTARFFALGFGEPFLFRLALIFGGAGFSQRDGNGLTAALHLAAAATL